MPGNEGEADLEQLRQAIEAVRALLPLVEPVLGPDARQIRDALSQLQMAYARLAGSAGGQGAGDEGGGGEGARRPRAEQAPQQRAAEARRAGAGAEQRPALGSGALTPRADAARLRRRVAR